MFWIETVGVFLLGMITGMIIMGMRAGMTIKRLIEIRNSRPCISYPVPHSTCNTCNENPVYSYNSVAGHTFTCPKCNGDVYDSRSRAAAAARWDYDQGGG